MSDGARTKLNWLWVFLAVVISVPLIVNQVLSWRAQQRLDDRLAAVRASGAPLNMAEAAQSPVPADKNAAAVLLSAAGRLDEFQKLYDAFWTSPLGKDYESREDRRLPPTPEQFAKIREIVDACPTIEATIAKAANCNAYIGMENVNQPNSAYITELIKSCGRMRGLVRFAIWKADLLLADGKADDAVQLCSQMLKISRVYRQHALIVQELAGLALEGAIADKLNLLLRANSVSAPVRARLDAELAKHDDAAPLVNTYKLERAFSLTNFDESLESAARVFARIFTWQQKNFKCDMLDYYDSAIALAALPYYQMSSVGTPTAAGPFAQVLPAIQANYIAANRVTAVLRSLRILNALAEFKEQNGREAQNLGELALPPAATIDPFSGKPLQLKMTPNGWVIYTIFQDGVDNGGDFADMKDFGLGPRGWVNDSAESKGREQSDREE